MEGEGDGDSLPLFFGRIIPFSWRLRDPLNQRSFLFFNDSIRNTHQSLREVLQQNDIPK
jgi:hypothetical protein